MKICFLSSTHPPFDKRVFDKEAVALAKEGLEVIHLAPDKTAQKHSVAGVTIVTYIRSSGIKGRLLQLPRLYRLASQQQADCYHCNEVDSWFVGILLKLIQRKKIIFDVHEHYPSTFAESRFPLWLHPLVANLIRFLFHSLSANTDAVIFAKRSVSEDFARTKCKQVLVQNFTPLSALKHEKETKDDAGRNEHFVTAIHLGLMSRIRGWPQLIDALAKTQNKNIRVHIVGTFNDGSRSEFDRRVTELKLDERVTVEDWMPFEQAYQRILEAQIGLVLFQPGIQNHVFASPHKMFDYMLAEIPVIAPDFAVEVAPIIKEAECGILVNPADPCDIADALDYLANNKATRQSLGHNGRKAVLEQYNWECEAAKLVALYNEI
ncbi:MAG: glycosyltransferase family 4 protein [Caldilineaceae bacterium]